MSNMPNIIFPMIYLRSHRCVRSSCFVTLYDVCEVGPFSTRVCVPVRMGDCVCIRAQLQSENMGVSKLHNYYTQSFLLLNVGCLA